MSVMWVEQCQKMRQKVPESLYPSVSIDKYSDPLFLAKLKVSIPSIGQILIYVNINFMLANYV